MNAINREMINLKVTFNVLDDGSNIPVGFNKASGNLVSNISMKLKRKDLLVKDGHITPEPEWFTFSRVESRRRAFVLH